MSVTTELQLAEDTLKKALAEIEHLGNQMDKMRRFIMIMFKYMPSEAAEELTEKYYSIFEDRPPCENIVPMDIAEPPFL